MFILVTFFDGTTIEAKQVYVDQHDMIHLTYENMGDWTDLGVFPQSQVQSIKLTYG